MLVRNVHDSAKDFILYNQSVFQEGGPYSADRLWSNLVRSDLLRLFWKDHDRRFLGASRGFLDFYGFSSAAEIIGRNGLKATEAQTWTTSVGDAMVE